MPTDIRRPTGSRCGAGRGASSRRRASRAADAGAAGRTPRARRREASPIAHASRRRRPPPAEATPPLPPVESLTIDSDFTAFLQPQVDERLKRQALKKLFRDPHFNVMDGLDIYIDDYSKPDPIPPDVVRQLVQGATSSIRRVPVRAGDVEDVPPEEIVADASRRASPPERYRRCRRLRRPTTRRRCPTARRRSDVRVRRSGDGRRGDAPSAERSDRRRDESRRQDAPSLLVQRRRCRSTRRRSRARSSLPARPPCKTMLCQKELAAFADHAAGDVVVACTQEARLFGDVAEEGGRDADDPLRQHPRDRRLVGRGARAPRPRSPRCSRLPGLPEPEPVPRVDYRSEGRLLIVGPAEAALHWAARCSRRSSAVTVLVTGRATGAELPAERQFPGLLGPRRRSSPAGSARSTSPGRRKIRSTSIFARAATRASAPVPRTRSTGATRSISIAARRIASASPRAARRPRSTSRGATSRAASASTSCSTCSATPHLRDAPAAAGLSRARRRSRRAGAGGGRARGDDRRIREAEILRVQGVDLRAQPLAARPAATSASTSARPRRSPPTAITSRSSRTCAWAAAPARPCARRAR